MSGVFNWVPKFSWQMLRIKRRYIYSHHLILTVERELGQGVLTSKNKENHRFRAARSVRRLPARSQAHLGSASYRHEDGRRDLKTVSPRTEIGGEN